MHAKVAKINCALASACLLLILSAPLSCVAKSIQQPGKGPVWELFLEGSLLYREHDFKAAIAPYEKALDLEKQNRVLDRTYWIVLIDNLGMAYGMTGHLEKAKTTFAYGISKEPEYPLFYYNMACTYAEMENMEGAIDFLKLAFDRRDNMLPGEKLPDPAHDSSFQRFMESAKFQAALKELNKK